MRFFFSELILKFEELLGLQKDLIAETFNKPDKADIIADKCISIKNFGEFHMLVVSEMDGQNVRFMNAYRIYPKLLDGFDVAKMKPTDVLKEFMDKFGVPKNIPGFGERKILVEKNVNVFFPGIVDIDKYLEAVNNLGNS